MTDVVQRLWGFCHVLRHDGIDYGDYIEQITYLLFLKMADERAIDLSRLAYTTEDGSAFKTDASWPTLADKSGTALTDHYADALRVLGRQPGILGDIFAGAVPKFSNPVNLKRLIALIDEEDWTALDKDIKAEAYEGLLEKAASEGKKGAGQYFTPRILIQTICRVIQPDPRPRNHDDSGKRHAFTIADPACGTGGFLVAAYEWLLEQTHGVLDRNHVQRIRQHTYAGQELVARPRRLALMNLYLHGLEPSIQLGDTIYEAPSSTRFDVILTNPPFGTKGANQMPQREDFVVETANKQLNFIQHILTVLKPGGRAAVVLPDNCLFADQAGEVFKILAEDCDLHTVLRLPRGTFTPYCPGVKANVVFFTKGTPTQHTWIYDARSNVPGVTKKERPLTPQHFAEFEHCYGSDPNGHPRPRKNRKGRTPSDSPEDTGWLGGGRWRSFHISEIKERDFKLDAFRWIRDDSLEDADDLPEPEELATDAIGELQAAVEDLNAVLTLLEPSEPPAPGSIPESSLVVGEART